MFRLVTFLGLGIVTKPKKAAAIAAVEPEWKLEHEKCSSCGKDFPVPISLHHSIQECDYNLSAADRAEQLQVQLAGCGVAALGGTNPDMVATPDHYGWSPSYQDVLDLRRKYGAAVRILAERSPLGQEIALYPCGCSAVVNHFVVGCIDGAELGRSDIPRYCDEHGNINETNRAHVIHGTKIFGL